MTKFIKSYYAGGHRVMLGGVPCRVSRLPRHEGGKALMAQSSRDMCIPGPPRARKDFAAWEKAQLAAYKAADKLGGLSIDEVVPPTVKALPEPLQAASGPQPVQPERIEPQPMRVPSRPVTRRPLPVISGAMRTVHYYRVSTQKQGRSGLGLDAQRSAVEAFCAGRGCEMVAEFVEVESGKNDDRPKLAEALHLAKVTGSTLVIAKLDRLSRNVAFLAQLQDAGVRFVCADMAEANELTLHIMAAMAQAERKAISSRTKAALAATKARGTRLGNPLGAKAFGDKASVGREMAAAANRDQAQAFAMEIRPIIDAIRGEGHTSLRQIAAELNRRKIVTARGGSWSPNVVNTIIARTES